MAGLYSVGVIAAVGEAYQEDSAGRLVALREWSWVSQGCYAWSLRSVAMMACFVQAESEASLGTIHANPAANFDVDEME